MFDFYDALNVPKDSSTEEIRAGYLTMSRLHHPDKVSSPEGGGDVSAAFRDINRAYRVLSDPPLREFYDKHGFAATELAETELPTEALAKAEDKLKFLEKRVRMLIRSSDELQAQRWLQPNVSLTMGSRILEYSPLYCSWSHTVTSAGVLLGSLGSDRHTVSAFVSSHTQRGGAAVSRASLVLGSAFTPSITLRSSLHVMGGRWPGCDFTVQKTISETAVVRQVFASDGAGMFSVGAEWIQQLGESVLGTLGFSLSRGMGRGISFEIAKKSSDKAAPRGKFRLALQSTGDMSIGGKVKVPVGGMELQVGPSLSSTTGVSFDVAIQTELAPIVEEQEGAFPTFFTWSISIGYPRELTLGLKLSRGGFSFDFPVELPEAETKWALVTALALWTLSPLVARTAKSLWKRRYAFKNGVLEAVKPKTSSPEGEIERTSIIPEAKERRAIEQAKDGLIIVSAIYANDIDVTDVLMARVRDSSLALSSSTKSTLVGFRYPTSGHDLRISYKFGGISYERVFSDTDIVILP